MRKCYGHKQHKTDSPCAASGPALALALAAARLQGSLVEGTFYALTVYPTKKCFFHHKKNTNSSHQYSLFVETVGFDRRFKTAGCAAEADL